MSGHRLFHDSLNRWIPHGTIPSFIGTKFQKMKPDEVLKLIKTYAIVILFQSLDHKEHEYANEI